MQRIALFEISTPELPGSCFRELKFPEMLIVMLVILILSAWYFFAEWKNKELKIHYPLLILLSILFFISMGLILSFPSKFDFDVPVYTSIVHEGGVDFVVDYYKHASIRISTEQRLLYILVSFATLYMTYILLWIMPRKMRSERSFNIIMYVVLLFVAISFVYSYVTEFGLYQSFFSNPTEFLNDETMEIHGFFDNKNSFGMLATFGCFASLYLLHSTRKWWFIPISIFIGLHTILFISKTNALVCISILLIYLIYLLVINFKKYFVASIIVSSIFGTIIIAFATLSIIHQVNNDFLIPFFDFRDAFVDRFIINAFQNSDGFTGRVVYYEISHKLLNNGFWIIGMGYGLFNEVFLGMDNISHVSSLFDWNQNSFYFAKTQGSTHNSFYQIVGSGGYIALVVCTLVIIYTLYAMVMIFKKHHGLVVYCFLVLAGAIVHGIAESPTLIFVGPTYVDSLLLTIMAIIPVLSVYYHEKHPSSNAKYLAKVEQNRPELANTDQSALIAKSVYFFVTPLLAIVSSIGTTLWDPTLPGNRALLVVLIVLAAIFVVVPPVIQLIFDRKTKMIDFLLDVTAPYLIVLLIEFIIVYISKLIFGYFTTTMGTLFLWLIVVSYCAVFAIVPYMHKKAGIISYLLDWVCYLVYQHQKKYIKASNEEDSPTLQEKLFAYITPRRFKHNETRDN